MERLEVIFTPRYERGGTLNYEDDYLFLKSRIKASRGWTCVLTVVRGVNGLRMVDVAHCQIPMVAHR